MAKKNNKQNHARKGKGKGKSQNKPLPETSGKFDNLGGVMVRFPGVGLPRRILAHVRMTQQGYLAAAAAATGTANIYANAYYQPFNSTTPISSGWGLNLTGGSSTTANFVPNSFFSAGYNGVRVDSAMLKITAVCGAAGDSMDVFMVPAPAGGFGAANIREASGAPGFKSMMITSGMAPKVISSKVRIADVLGLTAEQYRTESLVYSSFTGLPSFLALWQVFYATMDGAALSQQVYFKFEIELDVEIFDPLTVSS